MIWKDCCFLERWGNEETRLAQHRLSHQASIIQSLVIPPELIPYSTDRTRDFGLANPYAQE